MKILGISCFYHDAAVALIVDGQVVAAAEEERFSRVKHDSGFPSLAIDFCLKTANINPCDINWVVFYEKPLTKFERITLNSISTVPKGRGQFVEAYKTWLHKKLWIKSEIASKLKISSSKVLFSNHHLAHASAAFYTSGFDNAALLTCDGVGEWTTTTFGVGNGNEIKIHGEIKYPHSLGLFYSTFTQFLGFLVNEGEFKVMGLAPYGKPKYVDKVEKLINQSTDGAFSLNLEYFNFQNSEKISYSQKFVDLFGVKPMDPKNSDEVLEVYADIAASAQKILEEKLLVISKNIRQKTGEENLCYSGGVALNGVANWRILEEAGFKNIFVHPAAGDSGAALGAALHLYHGVLKKPRKKQELSAYLGAKNEDHEIKDFIERNNLKAKKLSDRDLVELIADMIAKGKVIGWVQGRFEWGPRALGARSILADPRSKKMKDIVNSKIKFREAFRPFAPVCLYEKGKEIFDVGDNFDQQPLQYMIAVVPVKKEWQKNLGAITHVDGTARPQFIKREQNKLYYDVVKAFGKKTGVPVLLNTSFNLKGEPIVNTCEDAYKTFMASGIDALVLGSYVIKK